MKLANYYSRIRSISRNNGGSIAAALAYILREVLIDCRTGRSHDHRFEPGKRKKPATISDTESQHGKRKKRTDLFASFVACWTKCKCSIQELADALETAEKHPAANLGRDLIIAIPLELATDPQLMVEIVRLFATSISRVLKTAVIAAIHLDEKGNPHAHLFIPSREIDIDTETGQPIAARKRSKRNRDLTNPRKSGAMIREIRATWALIQNKCLKGLGINKRVYSGSYKSIGYPYLPTFHVGNKGGAIAEAAKADNILIEKRNRTLRESTLFADLRILRSYNKSLIRKLRFLEREANLKKRFDITIEPPPKTALNDTVDTNVEASPTTQSSANARPPILKTKDTRNDSEKSFTPIRPTALDSAKNVSKSETPIKRNDARPQADPYLDRSNLNKQNLQNRSPKHDDEAQSAALPDSLNNEKKSLRNNAQTQPSSIVESKKHPQSSTFESPLAPPIRIRPTAKPEANSQPTKKLEDEPKKKPIPYDSVFPALFRETTNRTSRKKKDRRAKNSSSKHPELKEQNLQSSPIEKGPENVQGDTPSKLSVKTSETLGANAVGKSKHQPSLGRKGIPSVTTNERHSSQNKAAKRIISSNLRLSPSAVVRNSAKITAELLHRLRMRGWPGLGLPVKENSPEEIQQFCDHIGERLKRKPEPEPEKEKPRGLDRC